jgi:hypothetical protein
MTSDAGRKTYWDLLETLRWICTRDEKLVERNGFAVGGGGIA